MYSGKGTLHFANENLPLSKKQTHKQYTASRVVPDLHSHVALNRLTSYTYLVQNRNNFR